MGSGFPCPLKEDYLVLTEEDYERVRDEEVKDLIRYVMSIGGITDCKKKMKKAKINNDHRPIIIHTRQEGKEVGEAPVTEAPLLLTSCYNTVIHTSGRPIFIPK